jgi:LemA protein
MNLIGIVILIGCGAAVIWLAVIYNLLVTLRNRCANARSQIDVQLKLRYELVPKLVRVVKGYASHERETFERVTEARARAISAGTMTEQAESERALGDALKLHDELTEIEDQIRFARQFYNDIVMRYNTRSEVFPNVIVANLFRFEEAEYFKFDD